jgi:hypothetical protein
MKVTIESAFLKAGINVKDGDLITFLDEGKTEKNKQSGKPQLILTVQLPSGETKLCSMNNTSKKNVMALYGDDTAAWVGNRARVNILSQMIDNELTKVIYLTAPDRDLEGNVVL